LIVTILGEVMPKAPDNKRPRKNQTEEKLRATPFGGVDEHDSEEKAIRLSVWRRFTEAKVVEELLTKPEFQNVRDELQAGLSCVLNGNPKDNIYRIFSEGRGMRLELNKKFAESLGEHQIPFFEGVVRAGIEGYGVVYMQVKGLLSRPKFDGKELETNASARKV
jgi:hypothetical protein